MVASPQQDAPPSRRRTIGAKGRVPGTLWLLPLLCVLAACGGGGGGQYARTGHYSPGSTIYPEPGPPEDPWRPYIRDASSRFSVPQQWIRAVIHQESGGHEYLHGQPITSGAGAMGLMQLMPATYADLQSQYNLGSDPYEPHDNIMAGTAYIHQMYQKYGAPAFLAAYNAGPQRLDDYLSNGRSLPNETINYVASIGPNLGTEIAMSGPLASYATGAGSYSTEPPVQLAAYRVPSNQAYGHRRRGRQTACWHDPDAAYDPDAPCQAPPPVEAPVQVAAYVPVQSAMAYSRLPPPSAQPRASAGCVRDPDAAYDAPCTPRPIQPAIRYAAPAPMVMRIAARVPEPPAAPSAYGSWAIQVGAFNSVEQARFATTMARQADFTRLAGSQSVVQQTTPFGHAVLYRARLAGLARGDAGSACDALRSQNIPCMVVTPGG
ncbi:transglycosylase SLT domain-containing protein [Lichenicola sp.]|uniref:transglycosylase SLT domain-containing protein n=1 Tax=Lichenicola sp. TaxID=2804529 RepID=UPI003B00FF11